MVSNSPRTSPSAATMHTVPCIDPLIQTSSSMLANSSSSTWLMPGCPLMRATCIGSGHIRRRMLCCVTSSKVVCLVKSLDLSTPLSPRSVAYPTCTSSSSSSLHTKFMTPTMLMPLSMPNSLTLSYILSFMTVSQSTCFMVPVVQSIPVLLAWRRIHMEATAVKSVSPRTSVRRLPFLVMVTLSMQAPTMENQIGRAHAS